MLKLIDIYILKKFLSTFFFIVLLLMMVTVAIDVVEKLDDFLETKPPLRLIILDYYFFFLPMLANMLSGFITFLAVIYVTSRMAYLSEIIAILSNGMKFTRMLLPFMIGGMFIYALSWSLDNFLLPAAKHRFVEFRRNYMGEFSGRNLTNFHRQVEPGIFLYIKTYNSASLEGKDVALESLEKGLPTSKLKAQSMKWNEEKGLWRLSNWELRIFHGEEMRVRQGKTRDTLIAISPYEMTFDQGDIELLNTVELNTYIDRQRMRGFDKLSLFTTEFHKRQVFPFSCLILTVIGVCLSYRRVRGGTGTHLGWGLALTVVYLFFAKAFEVISRTGHGEALFMMWTPNFIYLLIAAYFVVKAKG